MRNGCRLRLAPVSFGGIVLASQAPGSAARRPHGPRRVRSRRADPSTGTASGRGFHKVELKLPLSGGANPPHLRQAAAPSLRCARRVARCYIVGQHAASPASAPWRDAVAAPMVALLAGVPSRAFCASPCGCLASDCRSPAPPHPDDTRKQSGCSCLPFVSRSVCVSARGSHPVSGKKNLYEFLTGCACSPDATAGGRCPRPCPSPPARPAPGGSNATPRG